MPVGLKRQLKKKNDVKEVILNLFFIERKVVISVFHYLLGNFDAIVAFKNTETL